MVGMQPRLCIWFNPKNTKVQTINIFKGRFIHSGEILKELWVSIIEVPIKSYLPANVDIDGLASTTK
jgi:hypothetical protein